MSVETACLKQYAVLWPFDHFTGDGTPDVGEPQEIRVRHEDIEQQSLQPGEGPDAEPITVFADRAVANGGQLWFGRLDSLPATPSPLYTVVSCRSIPDVKARNSQYTLGVLKQ